ncbi:hypothetical protein [Pseudothauera hydrothermalis]|uniref:hypothetical protein n=1 Tax=Pseudothauera hydrothermalis TaxID=2184083 RepID=UPI000E097334|nr:hypothetical protein [Pseudothauera hydrothermalis]
MMAKTALKNVETQAEAKVPSGVRIVDGQEMTLDPATVKLLIDGWRIKGEIEALQQRLDEINRVLADGFECGTRLFATGVCAATVVCREGVKIKDAERLKAVLGFRFADLVKEETVYKPEEKLKEMAADGDEPLAPAIRACLTVSTGRSVTWRAAREA